MNASCPRAGGDHLVPSSLLTLGFINNFPQSIPQRGLGGETQTAAEARLQKGGNNKLHIDQGTRPISQDSVWSMGGRRLSLSITPHLSRL